MKPLVGLSLMPEQEFLQASLPLFAAGEVEAVEWSFDTILFEKYKPKWLHTLLKDYASHGRLIGHGVRYSMFDAQWTKRQDTWLKKLKKELQRYSYAHFTEHFGFMTSEDFHKGAPLPVPFDDRALQIGIDRIRRLKAAVGNISVGIENLAFAFSAGEVKKQGIFLEKLIRPVDGFLILDLHNIYCQSENFKIPMQDIICSYPLDKVRELHISGGSWQQSIYSKNIKKVRRDTHNERVPKELFEVLPFVLSSCPNIRHIIFERLGSSLGQSKEQEQFRKDFRRIKTIAAAFDLPEKKAERSEIIQYDEEPLQDEMLYTEQRFITRTILNSDNPSEALLRLKEKDLPRWNIKDWNPSMLETAIRIARAWD
jgi:uncharacterized protein